MGSSTRDPSSHFSWKLRFPSFSVSNRFCKVPGQLFLLCFKILDGMLRKVVAFFKFSCSNYFSILFMEPSLNGKELIYFWFLYCQQDTRVAFIRVNYLVYRIWTTRDGISDIQVFNNIQNNKKAEYYLFSSSHTKPSSEIMYFLLSSRSILLKNFVFPENRGWMFFRET